MASTARRGSLIPFGRTILPVNPTIAFWGRYSLRGGFREPRFHR